MPETDLIAQLDTYGAWLEQSTNLTLRPTVEPIGLVEHPPTPAPTPLHAPAAPRSARPARRLVAAAAAMALLGIGAVGATALIRDSSTGSILVAAPADPPGPLYVLPALEAGLEVAHGNVTELELPADQIPTHRIVVGTRSGDTYQHLATITVGVGPHELRPGQDWEPIELDNGPALAVDGFLTSVAQQQNGTWVKVITGPDRLPYATALIQAVTIDTDDRLQLTSDAPAQLLQAINPPPTGTYVTTFYEIATGNSTNSIVVETATATEPLSIATSFGEDLTVAPIRDTIGWQMTRHDADGEWNAVAWRATPNRMIFVSGHAPLHEITAIAETLNIIDEATWQQALPDHTLDQIPPG